MSMRKPAPSRRSLRPLAESLETRQLLSSLSTVPSATVSGTDTKGDRWTLTLYGPGTLNVVDKNGTAFTPANQFTPDDINTITVSGTVTAESRLVGKVTYVPANSDGRVFFQQLTINNTGEYGQLNPALVHPRASTPQNGIAAVDMPNFWLGETSGTNADRHVEFPCVGQRHSFWRAGSMLPRVSTSFASGAWTRPSPLPVERPLTRRVRTTSS